MITIASYNNPTDAQIAKGLLEANGVQCQLKNDHLAATLPISAVELQVAESQIEQAKALLEDIDPEREN